MEVNDRIVYYLSVSDIQQVAEEDFDRLLTAEEIKFVEDNLPGYIDWQTAIGLAIEELMMDKDKMNKAKL